MKSKPKRKMLLPLSDEEAALIVDTYRAAIGGSGRERDMWERIMRRVQRLGGRRLKYTFDASIQGHVELTRRPKQ